MWPQIFLFAFVNAAVGVSAAGDFSDDQEKVFRKCCLGSQSLIRVNESSGGYKCVNSKSFEKRYRIFSEPLYVGKSVVIKHGLPIECDELEVLQIRVAETELQPWENVCYDKLVAEIVNGSLKSNMPKTVALTCNRNEEKDVSAFKLKINQIRKCCPRGQTFDTEYHECKVNVQQTDKDWLADKLDSNIGDIYDVEYGLSCKMDEYSVELHEDAFLLTEERSNLLVSNGNGEKSGLMPGEWCMETEYGGHKLLAQVCTRNCNKFNAYCIRKCCPPGQHYKIRHCGTLASYCVPNEDIKGSFNISSYLDPLREYNKNLLDVMGIRIDLQCSAGKFALNRSRAEDQHWLTRDAYLETPASLTKDYCLEVFDRRECPYNDVIVSSLLCFEPRRATKDFRVSFIVITISCVCLALTLIVYCSLSELRNLHGRTLICHVSMMLLACGCLARVQHSSIPDKQLCTLFGYGIYFGFVAAFAWLNVMCFDIWWTFGSIRTVQPLRKSGSDRRRFIWYSVYAWSVTVVITLTMLVLDRYPVTPILDANMGVNACWFGSQQNEKLDWPHYIFFVIPMGLVTCTNFILWLLTARHCAQVKSEVHRLQAGSVGDRAKKTFRVDRAKYILTGKLWVVMGAGWVSELLSTVVTEPQWLWNIVDLMNELQGVFIFLILVVKPKVYTLIKKRLGLSPTPIDTRLEKPDARNNATSSGRTSSTFLSRTISSDERANLRISVPNNIKQP
ncbi:probable G-protein coupled receptor Mth-like 3 isoform X1 [Maniola hyperantus]|uniref:probable G-protein coupled receptor Mth-like 3 isoform X1 n=1 Tax=Aphantopus hyperantus TaxID=2795564 RepID=UPI001567FCEA|nr:probable G-protein coupled receptor Mth-like 3 isoform X1 [Maniola hyperantus]